jgi:hypothetical protein
MSEQERTIDLTDVEGSAIGEISVRKGGAARGVSNVKTRIRKPIEGDTRVIKEGVDFVRPAFDDPSIWEGDIGDDMDEGSHVLRRRD